MTLPITRTKWERIVKLYLDEPDLSLKAIAERCNVSQWTTSKVVHRFKHSGCPTPEPDWTFCPFCGVHLQMKWWTGGNNGKAE